MSRLARCAGFVLVGCFAAFAVSTTAWAHGGAFQPPPPQLPPKPPPTKGPTTGGDTGGPTTGGPTTGGGEDPPPPPSPPPPIPNCPAGPTTGGDTGGPTTPPDDVSGPTTGGGDDVGGGPTTGGGDVSGPTTGGGKDRPTTGGGSGPKGGGDGGGDGPTTGGGAPAGPTTGPSVGGSGPIGSAPVPGGGRKGSSGPGADHWSRWWFANRTAILDLSARLPSAGVITPSEREGGNTRTLWQAQVLDSLVRALDDDNEDVASGAAIAIGKAGDSAHAPSLTRVLEDDKRQQPVRESAALALGLLSPGDSPVLAANARAALERVAGDDREASRLRATAIYALGMRGEAASLPFLLAAAREDGASWDVPAAGASALGMLREPIARADLERLLRGPAQKRSGWTVSRVYAAHGLARLADRAALPALRSAARDRDKNVRRAAILALGALAPVDDDDTADLLVRLLHRDKDRACRNMAALALARTGHDRAASALHYAYKKGEGLHQPFAALALGLLARSSGDASLVSKLHRDLERRANADLRGALALAVGMARYRKAAPVLRELAGDRGDPTMRAHAAVAIGLMADRVEGSLVLRKILENEKSPVLQREAALGLGLLGDQEAQTILLEILRNGDTVYVQGSAAVSVGRIGGPEAAKALRELLENKDRPGIARGLAAVGLGLVLDRTEGRGLSRVGADLNWYVPTSVVSEILTIL